MERLTPEQYLEIERKAEYKSEYFGGEMFAIINPTFLAEVLSPSTEAYDRGRKFEHYRSVESLSEYLLVAQDRMHADLFTRQMDKRWLLMEASQPQDTLELRSIDCRISMAELYSRIALPPAPNSQS